MASHAGGVRRRANEELPRPDEDEALSIDSDEEGAPLLGGDAPPSAGSATPATATGGVMGRLPARFTTKAFLAKALAAVVVLALSLAVMLGGSGSGKGTCQHSAAVRREFAQDRGARVALLDGARRAAGGTSPVNNAHGWATRKRAEFAKLERVRKSCKWVPSPLSRRCGGREGHKGDLCSRTVLGKHLLDNAQYSKGGGAGKRLFLKRQFCESPLAEHAEGEPGVRWSIERIGPFHGTGGYDWNTVPGPWHDAALMRDHIADRAGAKGGVYVLGGLFGPVDHATQANILLPPLHLHHMHVLPWPRTEAARMGLLTDKRVTLGDNHAILIQSHGDSACLRDEGGGACLLQLLPKGYGYRINNGQKGLSADFEINDVRAKGSPPLPFYVELAVKWTAKRLVPVTHMTLSNPIGGGPGCYLIPLGASNLVYYNWTNFLFGPGKMLFDNFVVHTHQTMFDSLWIFKGNGVYAALEKWRQRTPLATGGNRKKLPPAEYSRKHASPAAWKGAMLPYDVSNHAGQSLSHLQREILDAVTKDGKGELVCEVAKPGLECLDSGGPRLNNTVKYFDRRAPLTCAGAAAGGVRLEANEQLTVIAFNTVRIQKGHHWKNTFRPDGGTKIPVLYQHSLMRFAFLRDDAKTLPPEPPNQQLALKRNVYAPAALFEYMRWPDDKSRSDWFDTLYNYD